MMGVKKMKKYTLIISLCLVVVILLTGANVYAQTAKQLSAIVTSIKIYHDDEPLSFDSPIVLIDGKTYVPLRGLCESLGMDVEWNGNEQKVNLVSKEEEEILIRLVVHKGSGGFAYQIGLSSNGRITSSVGEIERLPQNGGDDNFTPKVTRQKKLNEKEMAELMELVGKIDMERDAWDPLDGTTYGGWKTVVQYQGKMNEYEFVSGNYKSRPSSIRNNMFLLLSKLVNHSPIEIITFSVEDPAISEKYYNKEDW